MRSTRRFRAMAAEHVITVDAEDAKLTANAIDAAIAEVARIEAKYSRYRDDSVTTAINRAAGGAPVAIDEETAALVAYADRCFAMSEGRFDLTSGVLRRAWDFRRSPPSLPTPAEIDALRPLIGWNKVEHGERSIRLPQPSMEIDFGGIGKEYAADRAATILQEHGIAHLLVNLGGDVRAAGGQADGEPWRIGIQHPRRAPPAAIASLELADGAVATSGDYERFFEIDGRRYCHLLDPRTGWPVATWQSVSVIAPLAVVAGSCASIGMLMEADAPRFLCAQAFRWLGVDREGAMHGSERMP